MLYSCSPPIMATANEMLVAHAANTVEQAPDQGLAQTFRISKSISPLSGTVLWSHVISITNATWRRVSSVRRQLITLDGASLSTLFRLTLSPRASPRARSPDPANLCCCCCRQTGRFLFTWKRKHFLNLFLAQNHSNQYYFLRLDQACRSLSTAPRMCHVDHLLAAKTAATSFHISFSPFGSRNF